VKGAGWILLALALGFAGGALVASRSTGPDGVNPATRDSLAVAIAEIAHLEEARLQLVSRTREDSIALAAVQARVRVRAAPAPVRDSSMNPAPVLPETTTVYEVPAPVALLVTRLERRVVTLEALVDTTTLQLHAERNARKLAESIADQAERALEQERRRKWRYRIEGAAGGGIVGALAVLLILL
jgi:hypothetical protein